MLFAMDTQFMIVLTSPRAAAAELRGSSRALAITPSPRRTTRLDRPPSRKGRLRRVARPALPLALVLFPCPSSATGASDQALQESGTGNRSGRGSASFSADLPAPCLMAFAATLSSQTFGAHPKVFGSMPYSTRRSPSFLGWNSSFSSVASACRKKNSCCCSNRWYRPTARRLRTPCRYIAGRPDPLTRTPTGNAPFGPALNSSDRPVGALVPMPNRGLPSVSWPEVPAISVAWR